MLVFLYATLMLFSGELVLVVATLVLFSGELWGCWLLVFWCTVVVIVDFGIPWSWYCAGWYSGDLWC